jgi:hypothetical protein
VENYCSEKTDHEILEYNTVLIFVEKLVENCQKRKTSSTLITFRTFLSPLLCGDVEDIVPPDECVPVLVLQLTVHILLGLFQGYVHVPVQAGQHS